MATVQFIGKDSVVDAYNDLNGVSWGLYVGAKPVMYGSGGDSLEEWLDRFDPAGSTGVYTLRVYDCGLPVKPGTDYLAAFNFKLSDPYHGAGISGNTSKLLDRIGELEERLEGKDKDGDIMDHIIGWFKDPEKLETAVGAIKQLFGQPGAHSEPGQIPQQTMSGFKVTNDTDANEEKLIRLSAVLDKLEGRDPKLLEHLEKLSKLDALTFNLVISKLDGL